MLVQVIDVLAHAILQRAADRDVIEDRQVLHVLAEADAARVRADRLLELVRHQDHRERFVHAAHAAGVDLHVADRVGLQQLLEHHAVLADLAGGDGDRRDLPRDPRMPQHVVRTRRLLDPPGIEPRQRLHLGDGLVHVPALVGVHHQRAIRADLLAHDRGAADVVLEVLPDLHLEGRPPLRDGLAAQAPHLVVRISEPPGRRRVGGIAVGAHLGFARVERRRGARAASRPPRSGVSTSVMYEKSIVETSCSGDRSTRCFHIGFRSRLAQRSQTAFSTAPVAMCRMPFSGPSQRSCLSTVRSR